MTIFSIPMKFLRAAAACSSTDDTRESICGVRVEFIPGIAGDRVFLVATNGRVMIILNVSAELQQLGGRESFTIPGRMIEEIKSGISHVRVGYRDGCVEIESGEFSLLGKTSPFPYPDWRKVIPTRTTPVEGAGMFSPSMLATFRRAADLDSNQSGIALRWVEYDHGRVGVITPLQKRVEWLGLIMSINCTFSYEPTLPAWLDLFPTPTPPEAAPMGK